MRCPSCDHDNSSERRFCGECGTVLAVTCAACGASNGPGEKFCGCCGTRLQSSPTASAPIASAPKPEAPSPTGERRQLTVLFCDLVGSTPLSQQLDAEEWRDLLTQYQQAAAGAVVRFGGHVAKNLGDGLLIYFGWPTAREDDPERAIRAGLAILDAMVPLNATFVASCGTQLAVRIGMHTGPVVIGDGGEVFGDTANIAARVQSAADPDTVVITAPTHRLVAGMFVVEDRGPQELKGVRKPVVLYRVVQPSGVRSRMEVAAGRLTRFVGRDLELGTLVDRWERAQDGEGQTVLVLGEPGVGKSRLVYQLHEHLASVPHTWLECGATPYTEGTPFHPVIALVSRGLAFAPDDTAAEKLAKLEIGLRALASTENIALVADFLGLPPPTRLQLSPELQRRKTIDLLAQWNLALSEVQPLVLVVEDLHWCDVSTLELLGHLIAQSPTAGVLLLATARPEFAPLWPARSNLTTVQVARLTKRQGRDMVKALAGTELPAATLDALVARADGVPLYIEELTKAMAESGVARGVEAIPATLADSLMGRLDRLSAAKEVAQRAAVLGREFAYPLLAAMAGMGEAALRDGLVRLVDAEILFARGEPPAATYTFKHALIQETAYHSLLKRTRQQLHARVAQVLEDRFPERVAAEPEVAARHAEAAGLTDEAARYYERAGSRAQEHSAHSEAIRHLRAAIAIVAALPASRDRDMREGLLQLYLAISLIAARGYAHAETETAYERARVLCEAAGDAVNLGWALEGCATIAVTRGELERAIDLGERVLAIGTETRDQALRLAGHMQVGQAQHYQGRFAASLSHVERTAALSAPTQLRGPTRLFVLEDCVLARSIVAWNLSHLGYAERALARARDAVALARTVAHLSSLAGALFFEGIVHWRHRDRDAQHECATEILALSKTQEFPFWLGLGRALAGAARVGAGGAEAVAEIRDGLALASSTATELGTSATLALLAEALMAADQPTEALEVVEIAIAVGAETRQPFFDAELYRLQGELVLAVRRTNHTEAERLFRRALAIARSQEARAFELRAAMSLARLLQTQGAPREAHAILTPVYAWFTEGFATRDLVEAKALLDELA